MGKRERHGGLAHSAPVLGAGHASIKALSKVPAEASMTAADPELATTACQRGQADRQRPMGKAGLEKLKFQEKISTVKNIRYRLVWVRVRPVVRGDFSEVVARGLI